MERRMGGTQDSLGEACEGGSRWGQRQQTGWVTRGRGSMHTPPAKARDKACGSLEFTLPTQGAFSHCIYLFLSWFIRFGNSIYLF